MNRILSWKGFSLLLVLLLLSGCSAPPETRAGEWDVGTEHGDFTLNVSDDGMTITEVIFEFECKGMEVSRTNVSMTDYGAIEGNKFIFSVTLGFLGRIAKWEGKFSSNGKRLTGTVTYMPSEISGGCKENFKSSR